MAIMTLGSATVIAGSPAPSNLLSYMSSGITRTAKLTELYSQHNRPYKQLPHPPQYHFGVMGTIHSDILAKIHRRCSQPASRAALVSLGGVG